MDSRIYIRRCLWIGGEKEINYGGYGYHHRVYVGCWTKRPPEANVNDSYPREGNDLAL